MVRAAEKGEREKKRKKNCVGRLIVDVKIREKTVTKSQNNATLMNILMLRSVQPLILRLWILADLEEVSD